MKKKHINNAILVAWAGTIIMAVFPIIFLYCQNTTDVRLSEIFKSLIVTIGLVIAGLLMTYFYTKNWSSSAIITIVFFLFFSNFVFFEKFLKIVPLNIQYWHTLPLSIFLVLIVAYLVKHKMKEELSNTIIVIITIVFGALSLLNIIPAIPSIVNSISVKDAKVQKQEEQTSLLPKADNRPNIYYFLFDEYSGFESINTVYGYDNKDFYDFLINNEFEVSRSSHNESSTTLVVMYNILNLQYIVDDDMSTQEKIETGKSVEIYQILKNAGYEVRGVGNTNMFHLPNVDGEVESASVAIDGKTFFDLTFQNTMLYPLFDKELYYEKGEQVLSAFSYLNDSQNIPSEPTFTFIYLVSPHTPFVFKEDGSYLTAGFNDWNDPQYYLGQYKYVTNQITENVKFLQAHDPSAIIILQSDHAARGLPENAPEITPEIYTNILNAVSYPGENIKEINGLSGLNTIRVVLSKVIDEDFEILEVPNE